MQETKGMTRLLILRAQTPTPSLFSLALADAKVAGLDRPTIHRLT